MSIRSEWVPACPDCGVGARGSSVDAEGPADARAQLRGVQATCASCGATFKIGSGTPLRRRGRV